MVVAVVGRLHRRRQRTGAQRVTEREVVVLHGEDVREVARELDSHLELRRLHALVLDHDVILHPVPNEPVAGDCEDVVLEPAGRRVPQVEAGGEVLDLLRREQQRPLAVHGQAEP